MNRKKILVLCTGNSCRSQMAEGYLKHFAGDKADVFSAGIESHGLNPDAVSIMKEDGIDISHHTSDTVEIFRDLNFDFIITVCDHAHEHCPFLPGKAKRFHHNFPDPAKALGSREEIENQFREVRNIIREYCRAFVSAHV